MNRVFEIATQVDTPLALGGFIAAILFLILKQILKKNTGSDILKMIINKLFALALTALILGFIAFILPKVYPSPYPAPIHIKKGEAGDEVTRDSTSTPTKRTVEIYLNGTLDNSFISSPKFNSIECDLSVFIEFDNDLEKKLANNNYYYLGGQLSIIVNGNSLLQEEIERFGSSSALSKQQATNQLLRQIKTTLQSSIQTNDLNEFCN